VTGPRRRAPAAGEVDIRSVFAVVPDAIIGVHADGRIVFANIAAERLFGFSAEELTGMSVERLLPESMAERHVAHRAHFHADPGIRPMGVGLEVTAVRKDGTSLPVEIRLSHVQVAGEATAVASVRDVTERRRQEDALRRSEARLRETQAVAGLGTWELDLVRDVLIWSDEIYRLLEVEPAGFGANYQAFLDLIHPEDREMVDRAYATSVRERIPYHVVHRVLMADGRVKFVNERCESFFDEHGRAVRSVGTIMDVSAIKHAEEEVQANAQRLRVALGNLDVAVFHQDLDLRYTWMFQPQMGYSADAVLGNTDAELLPPDAARRTMQLKRRALTTGKRVRGEVLVVDAGGTAVYDITVEPRRDAAGAIVGLTGASLDITDRVREQARLEESQRDLRALALHADAVREEERAAMARNVHDDFGQVLTALKMDLRGLRRRAERGDAIGPGQFETLSELTDRLIATVRQVASDLRPPILEGLGLRESIELQAAEFSQRTGTPCRVECPALDRHLDDRTKMLLYRVVQESLTNVIRHAAATAVGITIRVAGHELELRIEDDGRGLGGEPTASKRFGVIGMRERTLALGGRFALRGGVHGGTVVEVVIPIPGLDAGEGGA